MIFPEDIQIRYSRFNDVPKNTLLTYRKNNKVYFGIARCNTKADVCSKLVGRAQARSRADVATQYLSAAPCLFYLDEGGLEGVCDEKLLHILFDYFYSLDR